jgi:hypothetical protein
MVEYHMMWYVMWSMSYWLTYWLYIASNVKFKFRVYFAHFLFYMYSDCNIFLQCCSYVCIFWLSILPALYLYISIYVPFILSKVATGGESCVYGYDPETTQQSSQWMSPSLPWLKNARQVKSNIKSMFIYFFILMGLFIRRSTLLVRQSIKSSVVMF